MATEDEWSQNLNITMLCPECKEDPPNLVEEFSCGDVVCGSCGLVLGAHTVDTRSEWRTFSNDDSTNDDPSRVGDGANMLLNGSQLETSIAFGDGNARSKDLHRAQNKSIHNKSNQDLMQAYKLISAHCEAANIPKTVTDTAKHLFKIVDDAKAMKGKSQDAVIAGCIFIACRQGNLPRTFREIFNLTKVPKKEIGRTFKALEKFFAEHNLSVKKDQSKFFKIISLELANICKGVFQQDYQKTSSTDAKDLIIRYCSELGLMGQRIVVIAQDLSEKASSIGNTAGRSPLSIAAASIYMAASLCGQPKTLKEIAPIVGVSDGTIRTSYKFLYQEREKLVKPEWLADGKCKMENLTQVN